MKRIKNKNRFWKIYGIAVGGVVLVILCGLCVFYDFIGAYEASQPQNVAEAYMAGLTEDNVIGMAESAIGGLGMKYEDPEGYIEEYRRAWETNAPICQKLLGEGEDPVYSVMCGDVEMCRLTLGESEGGKYGFQKWETVSCHFPTENITDGGTEYSVYVPAGAGVSVNGIALSDPAEENVLCPMVSELEAAEHSTSTCYKLGILYREPEIECNLDSGECSVLNRDGVVYCTQPGSSAKNYEIAAPAGAAVTVNGTVLGEEYVKTADVPYEYSEFEPSDTSLPVQTLYKTGELFFQPTVSASLDGRGLEVKITGDRYTAEYPAELMYSVTVEVPKGSAVELNGKALGEPDSTERAFAELLGDSATTPEYDIYKITGLFTPGLSVTGSLNGAALAFSSVTKNGANGTELVYTSGFSGEADSAVSDFAMNFTKSYFHYTSQGYNNLDGNLASALAYVQPGSELYGKIRDSRIGYYYVTPVTRETYNQLEVTGAFPLEDGSHVVRIAFDVDQTVVYVDRNYAGEILLHVTGSGDGMKISGMVIDSEG